MKYIIALLLTIGAFSAQATTPTKRLSLDIGRPENTFSLGPISRGSSEYIDCALYVRGTAYPTNDLSGSLWYSVANTSTTGVSISTVDADVVNGHVYIQMSTTESLGLSTNSSDYPVTYYASIVLTNATQTHVFDVGELVIRWDAATAGAGSATLSNSAQPTYFTALTDTPSSYTGQGGKAVTVNVGGTALEFTAAGAAGDLTAVQVSGSILTVASGTGPIPIVGLTTAAVQSAQITYLAGTGLGLGTTTFNLNGASVASLALADSALQTEVQDIAAVVALDGDIGTENITSVIGGTTLDMSGGLFYSSAGTVDISGGTGPALSASAFSASIDATSGKQIVGWGVLTNQIALLGGTTYSGGTNVDVNGTIINLDAAAVASDALADSALQNVVEDTTPQLGGNLDANDLDITGVADLAATQAEITHTALANEEHAIELIVDAGTFADVRALDIEFDAGTLTNGQSDAVMLININDFDALGGTIYAKEVLATEGLATVWGAKYGSQVGPFHQDSGVFSSMDSALVNAVDELADLTSSATNTSIFVADNDTVTIGDAAKFSDIEFILSTAASGAGIGPTFEYSIGIGTWATFTPTDGTTGMKFTGLVAWDTDDIPSWATGTGTEYLIRITRTRNSLSTTPIAQLVQISQTVPYYWDKDGAVQALSFTGDGSGLTGIAGGGGNWWTNAPTTEIAIATNTHSGGLDLLGSYDGTNFVNIPTTSSSVVGFSATGTGAALTIPSLAYTQLVYSVENYDTDGLHNASTGVFVPSVNGYWRIGVSGSMNTVLTLGKRTFFKLFKDGAQHRTLSYLSGDGSSIVSAAGQVTLYCETTNSYHVGVYTEDTGGAEQISRNTQDFWFEATYEGQ